MWGFGSRYYWCKKERRGGKIEGIIVVFTWMSSQERHLRKYVELYSSLGWNSLVCHSEFLNMYGLHLLFWLVIYRLLVLLLIFFSLVVYLFIYLFGCGWLFLQGLIWMRLFFFFSKNLGVNVTFGALFTFGLCLC